VRVIHNSRGRLLVGQSQDYIPAGCKIIHTIACDSGRHFMPTLPSLAVVRYVTLFMIIPLPLVLSMMNFNFFLGKTQQVGEIFEFFLGTGTSSANCTGNPKR
jgi:hypothetical protein